MFIKLRNLKIHYKISGSGDPIVLLHGWGGNLDCFSKIEQHLRSRFTVYRIDLPGFGLSIPPSEIWGGSEYAELIAQFIREMNINNPILLGHSLGGKIVVNLVAQELVKVKKIILVSSSGIQLPKPLKLKLRICLFKVIKFFAQLPMLENIFGLRVEQYRQKFGSNDYKNASGIMRRILVKNVQENILTFLPKIRVPTLLIWGDQDSETPLVSGRMMQKTIVGSRLQVMVGSGHFPFLDNWEIFVTVLDNFLG